MPGWFHQRRRGLRIAGYTGGLLGLAVVLVLVIHTDIAAMLRAVGSAGWKLLWLTPYRALFFLFYAVGWLELLRPYDAARRAGLGYVFWVTTVREAIDRLLPVASVGGGVAGIRLLRWRGLAAAPVSATVIVEVLLTLMASYLFAVMGLVLFIHIEAAGQEHRHILLALIFSLPVPVVTFLLLRYGSVFQRLGSLLRPLVSEGALFQGAQSLDRELRDCLHRVRALLWVGTLQLAALLSGSFEIWLALRLFGHPVSVSAAIALESLTQAVRHLAFFVPAGLGVQEASLVVFGQALGINSELALAVSVAKRIREVSCGVPALLSWQWMEGRRLRRPASHPC